MSAANVAVSDDRLKASRVSTLTRTVTRLDRSRMTTLAALAVVVLVVACAQRLADRGWRERIICNRLLQADLAQSFCEAEVAGLGIRDLEYPRRRPARKVRKINAANAFIYVGAALVLHGLLGVDVLPTAVILTVMVTAQSFGLSSLFGAWSFAGAVISTMPTRCRPARSHLAASVWCVSPVSRSRVSGSFPQRRNISPPTGSSVPPDSALCWRGSCWRRT